MIEDKLLEGQLFNKSRSQRLIEERLKTAFHSTLWQDKHGGPKCFNSELWLRRNSGDSMDMVELPWLVLPDQPTSSSSVLTSEPDAFNFSESHAIPGLPSPAPSPPPVPVSAFKSSSAQLQVDCRAQQSLDLHTGLSREIGQMYVTPQTMIPQPMMLMDNAMSSEAQIPDSMTLTSNSFSPRRARSSFDVSNDGSLQASPRTKDTPNASSRSESKEGDKVISCPKTCPLVLSHQTKKSAKNWECMFLQIATSLKHMMLSTLRHE